MNLAGVWVKTFHQKFIQLQIGKKENLPHFIKTLKAKEYFYEANK